MSKSRQNDLIKFDARMLEYNLARGILTEAELKQHLASLPDLSGEVLPLTLEDVDDATDSVGGEETH